MIFYTGSSTPRPITFPFTLRSLKDLPSSPILTGKRLLPSTPLTGLKAGSSHKPSPKIKKTTQQMWDPWDVRGWDPVKHAELQPSAPKDKGKGKGKEKK